MGTVQPKGLLTSLALFITLGLFSLATLFTVLILEVRNGQQQLDQRIAELSGQAPLAQPSSATSQESRSEDSLRQLMATVELIANRQRSAPSLELNGIKQKLNQVQTELSLLGEKIDKQLHRQPPPSPEPSPLDPAIYATLQQLQQNQQLQLEQLAQQDRQLQQLLEQSSTLSSQLNLPPTPHSDQALAEFGTTLQQLSQQLAKLKQQQDLQNKTQQQILLKVQQPHPQQQKQVDSAHFEQQLDTLQSSQVTLQQAHLTLIDKIDQLSLKANTPAPAPVQKQTDEDTQALLQQINTQQERTLQQQQQLERLVQQSASRLQALESAPPAPTLPVDTLEQIQSQLQQLVTQQREMETTIQQRLEQGLKQPQGRNLVNPATQSNTIKPYSYNAR